MYKMNEKFKAKRKEREREDEKSNSIEMKEKFISRILIFSFLLLLFCFFLLYVSLHFQNTTHAILLLFFTRRRRRKQNCLKHINNACKAWRYEFTVWQSLRFACACVFLRKHRYWNSTKVKNICVEKRKNISQKKKDEKKKSCFVGIINNIYFGSIFSSLWPELQ